MDCAVPESPPINLVFRLPQFNNLYDGAISEITAAILTTGKVLVTFHDGEDSRLGKFIPLT
ncbi:MAG: hypothetical protein JW881_21180 [Spirochaetales bacterium]|nr:hypothetical protein [Spirochaetales bacterium]